MPMGDRAFEKIGLHRKIAQSFTAQNTSKINKNDQHAHLHQHKINTLFNNNHFQLRKHILYGIAQCDHWNCRGLSFWFMLINRLTPIISSSIRRSIAWYCHYNLLLLSYKLHLLHQRLENIYINNRRPFCLKYFDIHTKRSQFGWNLFITTVFFLSKLVQNF